MAFNSNAKPSQSYVKNSHLIMRPDDPLMFGHADDGGLAVKIDGMLICPIEMFTPRQIRVAFKKWRAEFNSGVASLGPGPDGQAADDLGEQAG